MIYLLKLSSASESDLINQLFYKKTNMKKSNTVSPSSVRVSHKFQFYRKKVLGEGNSVVYRGTYEGKKVAVKRIVLIPNITGDGDNCEAQMKLKHENVVTILAVEEDDDFRSIRSFISYHFSLCQFR
jgi:hypothetical protein